MGKIGMGQLDSDLNVTLRTRGVTDTLVVEVVDGAGNQITSFDIGGNDTIGNGIQTVPVAGTAVQVSSSSVSCKKVLIQANIVGAAGRRIWIGGADVSATGKSGFALYHTQSQWFTPSDLNLIYIDAEGNNDSISYYYEN